VASSSRIENGPSQTQRLSQYRPTCRCLQLCCRRLALGYGGECRVPVPPSLLPENEFLPPRGGLAENKSYPPMT
jgi:hypothetical protein